MFNLGLPEMLVIGVAALLLFGPKRLPELAKSLGKGIRDFKKAVAGEEDEKQDPTGQISQPGETVASNKEGQKSEHKVD
jgi:sec-independent protein translocase protein TatA